MISVSLLSSRPRTAVQSQQFMPSECLRQSIKRLSNSALSTNMPMRQMLFERPAQVLPVAKPLSRLLRGE